MKTLLLLLVLGARLSAQSHVVVVLLDDVGIDKVGAYGHPTAGPTPVLDALAASGLRFTSAYANPVCSPTRAAMLTGRYGSRTGIDIGLPTFEPLTHPSGPFLPSDSEPWLPRLLPVRSYLVGKWHLNHVEQPDYHTDPIAKGFARWRGHLSNIAAGDGRTLYSWQKQAADSSGWTETTSSTFVTVDNVAEAWQALAASAGRHSLVWLAFNAPHPPWDELPPPGTFTPVGGVQSQAVLQQYSLEAVDTLLGQLMDFYAAQLPADAADTLWLILGDNGTPKAAIESPTLPSQHKGKILQGGIHVPLIAWGAGVAPGVSDALVHAVDFHATLIELFGGLPCARTDSISFAPVLSGGAGARAAVYARHAQPNGFGPKDWIEHAALDGHWKLIRREGTVAGPAVQLFDLSVDPGETTSQWPGDTPEELAAIASLQAVIDASSQP